MGASNLFVVEAAVARYAVTASSKVLLRSRSADNSVPGNPTANIDANYWLVVYLGSGPRESASWSVESTEVVANRIVLTYHKVPSSSATTNAHPYYYWVPLGALAPGFYNAELFDSDTQATTLMRRVKIAMPSNKEQ